MGKEKEVYARHLEFESRAKLKATSTTSGLLAGFAMVNMIELQIEQNTPEYLLISFAVVATLLVCVHVFALLISTCILPNLEVAVTQSAIDEDNTHKKMQIYIEISWILSTSIGIFLFIIEMCIQCWIKFWTFSFWAAVASTCVAVPTCVLFLLFAQLFYTKLIKHKTEEQSTAIKRIETIAETLTSLESLEYSPDNRRDSGGLTFKLDDYRASPRIPAKRHSIPVSYSTDRYYPSPAPSPAAGRLKLGTGSLPQNGSSTPRMSNRASLGNVNPGFTVDEEGHYDSKKFNRQHSLDVPDIVVTPESDPEDEPSFRYESGKHV